MQGMEHKGLTRLLMYGFSRTGQGHVARLGRLAAELVCSGRFQVAIASDQPVPHWVPRTVARHLVPHHDPRTAAQHHARLAASAGIIADLQPLAILVDHFPFSSRDLSAEIHGLLKVAQDVQPCATLFSVFRGFVGTNSGPVAPFRQFNRALRGRIAAALGGCVRAVLVTQPLARAEEVFCLCPDLAPFAEHTHFIGYPSSPTYPDAPAFQDGLAVAQVGGGGARVEQELRFIAGLMTRLVACGRIRSGWLFVGPHTPHALCEEIRRLLGRGPVRIRRWSHALQSLVPSADLYISLGGFNSTLEAFNPRSVRIVVPRITELGAQSEQLLNARYHQARGWLDLILIPRQITMETAVRLVANHPNGPAVRSAPPQDAMHLTDVLARYGVGLSSLGAESCRS